MCLVLPEDLASIVEEGHPALSAGARDVPVSAFGSAELGRLIDAMIAAMRSKPGVGLAAPQIGVGLRVAVLEDTQAMHAAWKITEALAGLKERRPFDLIELVNPALTPVGSETCEFLEGCLSGRGVFGLVPRYRHVVVHGFDRAGNPITVDAVGWQARILQHEVDHLDGVMCTSKMDPSTKMDLDRYKELSPFPAEEVRRRLGLQ